MSKTYVVQGATLKCSFGDQKGSLQVPFDFGSGGYQWPNYLNNTDLSRCNLKDADLSTSYLRMPNFKDANLKGATIHEKQLQYTNISPFQRQMMKVLASDDSIRKRG